MHIELLSEEEFISIYGDRKDFVMYVVIPKEIQDILPPATLSNSPDSHVIKLIIPSFRTTVKELKDMIITQLSTSSNGLTANKIQLKEPISGFLKDTQSIAQCNLNVNTTLELSLRSRGGKK